MNAQRDMETLEDYVLPELCRRHLAIRNVWFQQGGLTAYTAQISMDIQRRIFPGISRFGDVTWLSHSPDLEIPDFFLWGQLKSRIYIKKPRIISILKESIRQEISRISRKMLEISVRSIKELLQRCVQVKAGPLTVLISKH